MERMPHALTSVEHEGATWLLRSYQGLIFFKREADRRGRALFVLTELLPEPTPDAAVQLWKRCFPSNDWARFGISSWSESARIEGYEDEYYEEDDEDEDEYESSPMEHNLCFILAKKVENQPSSLRITTDLMHGDDLVGNILAYDESPVALILEDLEALFLSYIYTDFSPAHKIGQKERVETLLNSSTKSLISDTSDQTAQRSETRKFYHIDSFPNDDDDSDQMDKLDLFYEQWPQRKEALDKWKNEMPPFFKKLTEVIPLRETLSLHGEWDDFERLIRSAYHVHSPANEIGSEYHWTLRCKTPFQPPQLGSFIKKSEGPYLNILAELKELSDIIVGHFEPEEWDWSAGDQDEREAPIGSFVPEEIEFEFSAPSFHEKAEALVQLKTWLQGKVEAETIEKLLTPYVE